jgi:hypothetical protein
MRDGGKFKEALIKMIGNYKMQGNEEELRRQIIRYFVDKKSKDYIDDKELWGKIKKIGGKVIE